MVQRCGANRWNSVNTVLFYCWGFVKNRSRKLQVKSLKPAGRFYRRSRFYSEASLKPAGRVQRRSRLYFLSCKAKTRRNKSEVRALKSVRMFFSSTATILKTPFIASLVT
jgi:hypothetical protein